jgi:hypothetical protein
MSQFLLMLPGRDDLRLRVSVKVEEDNRFPTPLEPARWEEVEPMRARALLRDLGVCVQMADVADVSELRWAPMLMEGGGL